jgi:16S rRNA A1518/A1519 N6-dimethyltransferase RsmA/KsgA/DIM1 with predicted DNA glycosylase/AP lyase activity
MSIYGISLIISSLYGAPYVPTKNKLALEILKEVRFKKHGLFIELGSGDGRIVRTAIKNYPIKGIAVDINGLLIIWSKFLAKLDKTYSKITFLNKNILKVDLTKADYIYLFLFPALINKLIKNFDRQLKKGTVIISHGFPIEEYKNKLVKKVDRSTFPTYYYRI